MGWVSWDIGLRVGAWVGGCVVSVHHVVRTSNEAVVEGMAVTIWSEVPGDGGDGWNGMESMSVNTLKTQSHSYACMHPRAKPVTTQQA